MADHMKKVLESSVRPLSFVIFLSNWEDAAGFISLNRSPYMRQTAVVPSTEHAYITGSQHVDSQHVFKAVHATRVFFLQNDEGQSKWPVTPEKIHKLLASFKRHF